MMSEGFMPHWQWWELMTNPHCVHASDSLRVILTERAKLPKISGGIKGLDTFKSQLRTDGPAVLIRRTPRTPPQPLIPSSDCPRSDDLGLVSTLGTPGAERQIR